MSTRKKAVKPKTPNKKDSVREDRRSARTSQANSGLSRASRAPRRGVKRTREQRESTPRRSSKSVYLLVTGFGPFGKVTDNPTMHIARQVQRERSSPSVLLDGADLVRRAHDDINDNILSVDILEVSMQAVDEYLVAAKDVVDAILEQDERAEVILVHFGVGSTRQRAFYLEGIAYNEKTFRIPDVRGATPIKESIEAAYGAVGRPARTSLDLSTVLELVTEAQRGAVAISSDPGRYICNYIYFNSLRTFKNERRVHSLFVHVPHHDVSVHARTMRFARALLAIIHEGI